MAGKLCTSLWSGAPSGKVPWESAWDICRRDMGDLNMSPSRMLRSFSLHGQCPGTCGGRPFDRTRTALRPDRGGCTIVPRVQMPVGAQVSCVQGPASPSGTLGEGASPIAVICLPRYGCRTVDGYAHINSEVGCSSGGGAGGLFSAQCAFPGADGSPLCYFCQ